MPPSMSVRGAGLRLSTVACQQPLAIMVSESEMTVGLRFVRSGRMSCSLGACQRLNVCTSQVPEPARRMKS
jgi:hypothetical protein